MQSIVRKQSIEVTMTYRV